MELAQPIIISLQTEEVRPMRKIINYLGATILVAFMLSGCKELAKLPIGDYFDDISVNSSVKAALAADRSLDSAGIDVETKERVVFLKGSVASEEQKIRAGQIVFKVSGVRGVANNLQVQRAP